MQRRRERRYEICESVILRTGDNAEPEYRPVTILDISRSGYRVLSGTELTLGTEVLVTLNAVAIVGRVRHCEPLGTDSFTAGVEITKVISGVAVPATPAHNSGALLDADAFMREDAEASVACNRSASK